jgi:hypothetical protein
MRKNLTLSQVIKINKAMREKDGSLFDRALSQLRKGYFAEYPPQTLGKYEYVAILENQMSKIVNSDPYAY